MCFYPESEFNAFKDKGFEAGNVSKALATGVFNCAVKFNGTKMLQMPNSGNTQTHSISHVKYVTWTEKTAVVTTWGKYFYESDTEVMLANMTVSIVPTLETTISQAPSSFLLSTGYLTINGPFRQHTWEGADGTTQGGELSFDIVYAPRTGPWNVLPMSFYYALFDSEANALKARDVDSIRLAEKRQSTVTDNTLCDDSLTGFAGKAGNEYVSWSGESSAYVVILNSDTRLYVRAVPAIGAAEYPANSCGKVFDFGGDYGGDYPPPH